MEERAKITAETRSIGFRPKRSLKLPAIPAPTAHPANNAAGGDLGLNLGPLELPPQENDRAVDNGNIEAEEKSA